MAVVGTVWAVPRLWWELSGLFYSCNMKGINCFMAVVQKEWTGSGGGEWAVSWL